MRAIVIKKNFFELELEDQELILKTDLFKQGMVRVIFETEYCLLGGVDVKNDPYFNFQQNFQKKIVEKSDKIDFFYLIMAFVRKTFLLVCNVQKIVDNPIFLIGLKCK